MAVIKNKDSEENREFWSHVEEVAKQAPTVQGWSCGSHSNQSKQAEHEPQNHD
jgi:hypothetical protein